MYSNQDYVNAGGLMTYAPDRIATARRLAVYVILVSPDSIPVIVGDLVNFHPHVHCLVTDGCFMPNGWFYVLPKIDVKKLESLFRHKILKLLLSEKKISGELVEKLLSWKNSGFSVHNQVKIKSRDTRGRESLAQYILRSPFSLEKMTYQQQTKTVLYRSKMNPVLKKNFAVFPVLDCNPHHAYPQQGGATGSLLRLLQQRIEGEKKKGEAQRGNRN